MISTNFIIGTGFIKCIPITRSGCATTAPICVIEIEEVLVAKIASFFAIFATLDHKSCLISTFSATASINKSESLCFSSASVKLL